MLMILFFFFQAEDGIRDADVTGVQTCALPISGDEPARHAPGDRVVGHLPLQRRRRGVVQQRCLEHAPPRFSIATSTAPLVRRPLGPRWPRSEYGMASWAGS